MLLEGYPTGVGPGPGPPRPTWERSRCPVLPEGCPPSCRHGSGGCMLTPGCRDLATRPPWPRLEAQTPGHLRGAALALVTHFANSLGSSWRLGGQALISGMKNASAAHKKAQQTPAAGAWCSKGRKMLPENARRAGSLKNPLLQIYASQ